MAEPRTTADEAGDPSTGPERLLELTEKHPQLHRLLVMNPSTPEVARDWILATNRWAKQAYELRSAADGDAADDDLDAGPATAPFTPVTVDAAPTTTDEHEPAEPRAGAPHDPDADSAWGDFADDEVWGAGTGSPEPGVQPSVRIPEGAGVVPLGPAADSSASPAAAPASGAAVYDWPAPTASGAADTTGAPGTATAAMPLAAGTDLPAGPAEDAEDSGRTRRIWLACGSCLILTLVLIVVAVLAGRALLGPDEEAYQRDSSTTAAQSPTEEPSAEETPQETPSQEPVSPAPDGAQEMTALRSPTGNISCLLEEDSVACSVVERDFSEAGLEDCENGPFSIRVGDGEAATACGSSFLSDSAATLEYDRSATYGAMACTSRFDGMTCWNTMTGKGFFVNRVTYETF